MGTKEEKEALLNIIQQTKDVGQANTNANPNQAQPKGSTIKSLAVLLGLSDRLTKKESREKILPWILNELKQGSNADVAALLTIEAYKPKVLFATHPNSPDEADLEFLKRYLQASLREKRDLNQIVGKKAYSFFIVPTEKLQETPNFILVQRETAKGQFTEAETALIEKIAKGIRRLV